MLPTDAINLKDGQLEVPLSLFCARASGVIDCNYQMAKSQC